MLIRAQVCDLLLSREEFEPSFSSPLLGMSVMTEVYLLSRGKCCGSSCRHCPFNHINVPDHRRPQTSSSSSETHQKPDPSVPD